jgi:hypothetical protein
MRQQIVSLVGGNRSGKALASLTTPPGQLMGIWMDPVRVRAVVRADVGAGAAAFGADHAAATTRRLLCRLHGRLGHGDAADLLEPTVLDRLGLALESRPSEFIV